MIALVSQGNYFEDFLSTDYATSEEEIKALVLEHCDQNCYDVATVSVDLKDSLVTVTETDGFSFEYRIHFLEKWNGKERE